MYIINDKNLYTELNKPNNSSNTALWVMLIQQISLKEADTSYNCLSSII